MFRSRFLLGTVCAITLSIAAFGTAHAADADNDGVADGIDVCCNTPPGTPVNNVGRPVADLDNDCDVDMVDFGIFQISLTGPMACSAEVCDGVDNDCNCIVDDVGTVTCGTGACQVTVPTCINGVPQTCTPAPASTEICDGIDNDCDGVVDDNTSASTWYQDQDGDGYGDLSVQITTCNPPPGYAAVAGDCDDTDASISPSAGEVCNNIDDDCDGTVDDNVVGGTPWYADADGDGYGNPSNQIISCNPPTGYVSNGADCNDLNAMTHPGGFETCNGNDDDCDGTIDDNLGTITCGTGACQNTVPACFNGQPNSCTPGNSSPEVCDGIDNDCNGMIDESNPCASVPNASGTCTGTSCSYTCDAGYADCDGTLLNGCEISVTSNPNNCGACGNACVPRPNAVPLCVNGNCTYVCNVGYVNCNNDWSDGCEIYVMNDTNNCGGCGMVCPSGYTCTNGQCQN